MLRRLVDRMPDDHDVTSAFTKFHYPSGHGVARPDTVTRICAEPHEVLKDAVGLPALVSSWAGDKNIGRFLSEWLLFSFPVRCVVGVL